MADVEIIQNVTEVKKTKKVKKTSKRRESEVQITEVEQTNDERGYVSFAYVTVELLLKNFERSFE